MRTAVADVFLDAAKNWRRGSATRAKAAAQVGPGPVRRSAVRPAANSSLLPGSKKRREQIEQGRLAGAGRSGPGPGFPPVRRPGTMSSMAQCSGPGSDRRSAPPALRSLPLHPAPPACVVALAGGSRCASPERSAMRSATPAARCNSPIHLAEGAEVHADDRNLEDERGQFAGRDTCRRSRRGCRRPRA